MQHHLTGQRSSRGDRHPCHTQWTFSLEVVCTFALQGVAGGSGDGVRFSPVAHTMASTGSLVMSALYTCTLRPDLVTNGATPAKLPLGPGSCEAGGA